MLSVTMRLTSAALIGWWFYEIFKVAYAGELREEFLHINRLIWATLIAAVFFSAGTANAGELIIHGPSHHFEGGNHNNLNYGLGYAFDNRVVVGTYRNSLDRTSVYAGRVVSLSENFGVLLGAVTGYEGRPVQPAAVATFSVPLESSWRLHLNVAPAKRGFVHLAIGRRM